MRHAASAGNDARHGGMTEYPLEEILAPARAVEIGRPLGQGLDYDAREEGARGKGPVDDDRSAAVGAYLQQAGFGLALGHRKIELGEIVLIRLHQPLQV